MPALTTTGPRFIGKPFTVLLDDRKITGTRSDGRAVFRNRSDHSVRAVITVNTDATGAHAVIFGGQTPGLAGQHTDCDVVQLNADWGADRPDKAFPTRYYLGRFRRQRSAFIIRNVTIRELRRRGDSVAVMGQGLVLCGDV